MDRVVLFALVAATATAFMVAQQKTSRRVHYALKPLPMVLLIAGLFLCGEARDGATRSLTALGLVASLAGDMFLIDSERGFLAGLAAFLVAHLLYIAAFACGATAESVRAAAPLAAIYLVAGAALCVRLFPRLGKLRLPVAAYAVAIVGMCAAAWARGLAEATRLAPVGATLFFLSDGILAVDKFDTPFRAAKPLLFALYIAGQAFITAAAWASPGS